MNLPVAAVHGPAWYAEGMAKKRSSKKATARTSARSRPRAKPKSATRVKPRGATKRFTKAKDSANAKSMGESRGDFGQPGSVAIERLPEGKREIAETLDALIREVEPDCESVVKWGNCCYSVARQSQRIIFAAIMETKSGLNLAVAGTKLDDPEGLLEGTGKSMRHVKFRSVDDVHRPGVRELIEQASQVGIEGM